MVKKKRRYTAKTKGRMVIIFLFFGAIILTLSYTLITNLKQINDMNKEKKNLKDEMSDLKDKKESLESDIERLSDDEYIARYAREKYFYSRNGEFILRMEN